MKSDHFWILFLGSVAGIVVFGIGMWRFHSVIGQRPVANVADVYTSPGHDPFEHSLHQGNVDTPFVYRESLAYGFFGSTWSARADWRQAQYAAEGSYAAKITYTNEWGGVYIETGRIATGTYPTLELIVMPIGGATDLYLEAYGSGDRVLGRQPLGWYTAAHRMQSGTWQPVRIPLRNVGVPDTGKPYGIAIVSGTPGVVYLDDIHFSTQPTTHTRAPTPPTQ